MSMSMTSLKRAIKDLKYYATMSGQFTDSDVYASNATNIASSLVTYLQTESDKSDKAYETYKRYESGQITADEALRIIAALYTFDM